MTDKAATLLWRGSETAASARALLKHKQSVNLQLAANYHHAIINHLKLNASPEQSEVLKIEGGPELLSRIAEIRGLEAFSELVQPALQASALVRLEDPALVIIFLPD